MRKYILLLSLSTFFVCGVYAQKKWTLEECIKHAIENNIDIKQSAISVGQSELSLRSAKDDKLPSLNGSLGGNIYFGRAPSRDGTTMDTNIQHSGSLGASSSVSIYEGGRLKNTIEGRRYALLSTIENLAAAKESVALQVVGLYMQVQFQYDIYILANLQIGISEQLVERNKSLLESGKITEKEYYESRSLLANDKLQAVEAQTNYKQSLLNLSQALNVDNYNDFHIATEQMRHDDNLQFSLPSVDAVLAVGINERPSIKGENLRLKELEYNYKIAKSYAIPTLSLSASYGTSYFYAFNNATTPNLNLIDQLSDNGNQSIGVSLSIPIFNKFSVRNQKQLARLNIINQQLTIEKSKQNLRKEIEQAYQNALQSWERYIASAESLQAAQKAFHYVQVSTEEGRTSIYDFNNSKNQLLRSESELTRAKYEYLLNCKIVDFYNGKSLY